MLGCLSLFPKLSGPRNSIQVSVSTRSMLLSVPRNSSKDTKRTWSAASGNFHGVHSLPITNFKLPTGHSLTSVASPPQVSVLCMLTFKMSKLRPKWRRDVIGTAQICDCSHSLASPSSFLRSTVIEAVSIQNSIYIQLCEGKDNPTASGDK